MTRFIRFRCRHGDRWGVAPQNGDTVRLVEGSVYGPDWEAGAAVGALADLELLPPCEPRTVAALAYNYKDLVGPREQYDEPLVFLKSPSCIIGTESPIGIPEWVDRVWMEVELAVVIGKPLFEASRDEAARGILGVTIANDVTASNVCGRDHHLARSKSLQSFCPVGSDLWAGLDTDSLRMTTTINGRRTQCGSTSSRIMDEADSVALVSRMVQLLPGDLVLTGTPAGAMDSVVRPGDRVELEIESIGRLSNPICERSKERTWPVCS